MPGVTELVNAATERGETYESMGAGKASKADLIHYVIEIADECNEACDEVTQIWEGYADATIEAAIIRVWRGK